MKKDELLDIYVNRFFDGLKDGKVPKNYEYDYDDEDAKYAEMSSVEQDEYAKKRLNELNDWEKRISTGDYKDSLFENCMDEARELFEAGVSSKDTDKIMEEAASFAMQYSEKYDRKTYRKIMSEAYDWLREELINLRKESNNKKR